MWVYTGRSTPLNENTTWSNLNCPNLRLSTQILPSQLHQFDHMNGKGVEKEWQLLYIVTKYTKLKVMKIRILPGFPVSKDTLGRNTLPI